MLLVSSGIFRRAVSILTTLTTVEPLKRSLLFSSVYQYIKASTGVLSQMSQVKQELCQKLHLWCLVGGINNFWTACTKNLLTLIGGTKIGELELALLQRVLQTVPRDESDSRDHPQELLKKNITYEELEILLGRDQNTSYLSKDLKEKVEQSEFINECLYCK